MIKILYTFIFLIPLTAFAAPNNFFYNLGKNGIITNGAGRSWQNNTFAKSCKEYKNPLDGHQYSGKIGSGTYTIKPDTASATTYNVYCDMVTDGGGWTMNFVGNSNLNYVTTSSQYISDKVASDASEILTYYTSDATGSNSLSTKYKFTKPSGFNLFTVNQATSPVSVTNLSTSEVATYNVIYGYNDFPVYSCDGWYATSTNYGRFGICVSGGSSPSSFYNFPYYSAYNTGGSDLCSFSNQAYNTTSCSSSRFLILFFR